MATVLGIRVTDAQTDRWRGWAMPAVHPFRVSAAEASSVRSVARSRRLSPEWRDTFELYDTGDDERIVWLDRDGARLLSDETIAAQPTTHRWPTSSVGYDRTRAISFVKRAVHPVDHVPPSDAVWRRAAEVLPDARRLAARFPRGSGPNCFGLVMAAAGVAGAEGEWMQREPFEHFLRERTIPGGNDLLPGTVFVWRDGDGHVAHAGVTLGDDLYLHKASQGWMTPSIVLRVRDGIIAARTPGQHIERHTLVPAHLR